MSEPKPPDKMSAEDHRIRNTRPAGVTPLTDAGIQGYHDTVELVRSGKDEAGTLGYIRDMTRLLATIDALKAERGREKERADKEEGDRRAADHALNDFVCTWSKAAPETAKVRAVLEAVIEETRTEDEAQARGEALCSTFTGQPLAEAHRKRREAVRALKGGAA